MEPEFTRAVGRVRPGAGSPCVRGWRAVRLLPLRKGPLGQGRAIGLGVSDCQGRAGPDCGWRRAELLRACALSSWEFDNLEAGQSLFVPDAAEEFASPVIDVGDGYEAYETILRARSPKFFRTTTPRNAGSAGRRARSGSSSTSGIRRRCARSWSGSPRSTAGPAAATGSRRTGSAHWYSSSPHPRAGLLGCALRAVRGDRPVAAHFGLRSRTVLSCWFPAYDPEFAKYSPGLILHLRMAEAAAAEGIGMLDLGRGAAEYKDALKTGAIRVYEGLHAGRARARRCTGSAGSRPAGRTDSCGSRPKLAEYAQRTLNRVGRLRDVGARTSRERRAGASPRAARAHPRARGDTHSVGQVTHASRRGAGRTRAIVRPHGASGSGPSAVAELDLDGPGRRRAVAHARAGRAAGPEAGERVRPGRLRGRPVGTVLGRVREGEDPAEALAAAFRGGQYTHPSPRRPRPPAPPPRCPAPPSSSPPASAADSSPAPSTRSSAQDHPDFRVLVVENAPATASPRPRHLPLRRPRRLRQEPSPGSPPPTTGASPPPTARSSRSPTTTSSPTRTGSPPSPRPSPANPGSAASPA